MCVFGAGFVGLLFYHDLPWPKTLPSLFSDRLLAQYSPKNNQNFCSLFRGVLPVTAQLTDLNGDDVNIGMKVEMVTRKLREEGSDGQIVYGYKFRPLLAMAG